MPLDRSRALDRGLARVLSTRDAVGDAWPYHADPATGIWVTTDDGDWCDGHWVEMLRIAGELLGRRELVDEAVDRAERCRPKLERDDQFRGHRFYYAAARLWAAERIERMRTLALAAAWAMRSMAMHANGAMPIGTQVQVKSTTLASRAIVAVDNVHPNLMLDWWAWRETGDATFARGAARMFDVLERHFVRQDGTTVEFIEFDPGSGEPRRHFTLLGLHDDSCWSRGQAWAIAGSLHAYAHTGAGRYARLAERLFAPWWARCGADPPPWDLADTSPAAPVDTSATAIVCSALARLAVQPGGAGAARALVARLDPMLAALAARQTPLDGADTRPPGMLLDGCFNQPRRFAAADELLWGDFYLLEALYALERGSLPC